MRSSKFYDLFGALIEPTTETELADLRREEVAGIIADSGVILFRGFKPDLPAFETFTSKFGAGGTLMNRRPVGDNPTTFRPPESGLPLPLHTEAHYRPRRPVLVWFHCMHAAETGGNTTLGSGADWFRRMAPATQNLFIEQRISYFNLLDDGVWQQNYRTKDPVVAQDSASAEGYTIEWRDAEGGVSGLRRLETSAISGPAGSPSFVNSISVLLSTEKLHSKFGLPVLEWVRLDRGDPIPKRCVDDIFSSMDSASVEVPWQVGDVLMIDNRTILHGRRAYTGRRELAVRICHEAMLDANCERLTTWDISKEGAAP